MELKIRRGEFLPACLKRQFLGLFLQGPHGRCTHFAGRES